MYRLSPQISTGGGLSPKRRRQSSPAPSANGPRELGQMRTNRDTGSGSASFVGSGSGIYFVRTVRRAFASKNNSTKQIGADTGGDDELVPGEDDRLHSPSPSSMWRSDELSLPDSENGSEPRCTFEDLVRWSKPYFGSWHPPFPFLHAPTVLEALEKISIHGFAKLDQVESVIVRSVMSISVADRRQMPIEEPCLVPSNLVFHTTNEAMLALQFLIIQPSSLPNLQAVVSVQLFLISMLRLNAASRIGGFIVRMALHLGLHRCPSRFEQFSAAEVDIRRRLFWSIYSLERYLSQSLGLPLDLRDDDLDVCYYDNETHQPSTVAMNHSPRFSTTKDSHLILPTLLAKHGRIKGLILELRNKSVLHRHSDPDELARIDAEISRWWNKAQDLVDPIDLELNSNNQFSRENNSTSMQIRSSHKLLLLVQKHESVILLNRPVITSDYNTSSFAAAMQKCIGASKAIVTNVYRHLASAMEAEGELNGRIKNPLVWPGFVWMVWQSGMILLYAASEGYYSDQVAQREASRCVVILENLALRGTFWPSSCAAVIKELQSALSTKMTGNSSPSRREIFSAGDSRPNMPTSRGEAGAGAPAVPTDPTRLNSLDPSENFPPHEVLSSSSDTPYNAQQSMNPGYFPNAFASNDFDTWPNIYGRPGALRDDQDESYDIFRLMDPSYLLGEQIHPAQTPEPVESFGHMLINTQGAGHQQH